MRKYCIGLWAVVMMACNSQPKQTTENTKIDRDQTTTVSQEPATDTIAELQVERFRLPPAISGCSALYASDSAGLLQGELILASNVKDTAYVKVNGQLQPLVLKEKVSDKTLLEETYIGPGITVQLKATQQEEQGEKVRLYKGEIIIQKGEQRIMMPVIGAVNC